MDDYILTYRLDYSGLLSPIDTSQDPLAGIPAEPPPNTTTTDTYTEPGYSEPGYSE